MTIVVASLVEGSIAGVSRSSKAAFRQGAEAVEVRLDYFRNLAPSSLPRIRDACDGPTIATLRSTAEGGRSRLTAKARESMLREIVSAGFHGVDLETGNDRALLRELGESKDRPLMIASSHLTDPVSESLVESTLAQACMLGDVGKVAMTCENAAHAVMLASIGLRFAARAKRFVIIGMGDQGQLTRVCAEKIGSSMMYSCVNGKEAAPGQLDVRTQKLLRGRPLLLGLVGHPVSHSVSKHMQEAALRDLKLAGAYLPLDFPQGTFDLQALTTLRTIGVHGLNVTIPHKAAAFEMADKTEHSASATRAVNTIIFRDGKIIGENTDVFGFSKLIEGKIHITKQSRVLVFGAGGASRAVAHVLKKMGAKFEVADIEATRATELAKAFAGKAVPVRSALATEEPYDLVVNCTPVGMRGMPGNPVKANLFRRGSVFIDIVYNPELTAAMKLARNKGAKTYSGLEMLVQQGAQSFRLWTGREPDVGVMRNAARRALR